MADDGRTTKRSCVSHGTASAIRGRASVRGGFTLIELIIVVLLVGIILSMAAPSFRGLGNDVQNAARESSGFLRQTRAAAIAKTSAYRIVVVSDQELRTEFGSTCTTGSWENDPRLTLVLREGVKFEGGLITAGTELVCFSSRGIGDASPSFVVRDRQGNAYQLDVFTGGAVVTTPLSGGGGS